MNVGIIAVIVVFQQEIRRFLLLVGKNASCSEIKRGGNIFSARQKWRRITTSA
jgi:diadenylate cyclase